MYDSLNRRFLEPYGSSFNKTPNFQRLAEQTVQFDNFYVASLPCMPARRDIHTGRPSFLHRSWGALEPFDNSMPEILDRNGVFSKLISDHYHYWEDGGATYHSRYSGWECIRGQECDQWALSSEDPIIPEHVPTMREFTHPRWWKDNWKNRKRYRDEKAWPSTRTFDEGLRFLEENAENDQWFVQIETFSPHEPFDAPESYDHFNGDDYNGAHFDWPSYAPVTETKEQVEHMRRRYEAVLDICDKNLGRILDFMDEHDMWKDTMLIVNTDHGFFLGEKEWWAKSVMPCYNELANIPFFLWDPRTGIRGERRKALCQTIDVPATILEFFGIPVPAEMTGRPLRPVIENDEKIRDYAIYGFHGSFVNITDGRYVYMRASDSVTNSPLYEYTCIATHQQGFFTPEELSRAEIAGPFPFTKGAKVMKIPVISRLANATFCNSFQYGSFLFDLKEDPKQQNSIDDPEKEAMLINALVAELKKVDAPAEQYERLGIRAEEFCQPQDVLVQRQHRPSFESFPLTARYQWTDEAKHIFIGMLSLVGENRIDEYFVQLEEVIKSFGSPTVTRAHFEDMARRFYSEDPGKIFYFLNKLARLN